ncbi:hypothetical protein L1987_84874 [Smallanthus sonchifolius]|uniref:Uncharacterized protein n=1 Tax=Smallanthus sonchifolius TaxID=185202 RepID=A0ACB8XV58_9ASTR|nr:hypothetical protein L1987_84874 [Smallanthus sonchifolius]
MMSLDLTPVTGSVPAGMVSVPNNLSQRPSLYIRNQPDFSTLELMVALVIDEGFEFPRLLVGLFGGNGAFTSQDDDDEEDVDVVPNRNTLRQVVSLKYGAGGESDLVGSGKAPIGPDVKDNHDVKE